MTLCSKYPKELTHYDKRLKKKCLQRLRNNVWECKTSCLLMARAAEGHRLKILRECLRSWMFYAARRRRKRFLRWEVRRRYEASVKRKVVKVLKDGVATKWALANDLRRQIDLKMKRASWDSWTRYVGKRQRSREIKALTTRMRKLNLIKAHLDIWRLSVRTKIKCERNQARMAHRRDEAAKRRALDAWKDHVVWSRRERDLVARCRRDRENALMTTILRELRSRAMQKRLYREHVERVKVFFQTSLLRKVLDKWQERYDDAIEARNADGVRLAVDHFNARLSARTFDRWRKWSERTGRVNASMLTFSRVADIVRTRHCIDAWRKSYQERVFGLSLETKASKWRVDHVRRTFLQRMLEVYEARTEDSERMAQVAIVYETNIKRRAVGSWKVFAESKRRRKEELSNARRHYEARMMGKVVLRWKAYAGYGARKKNAVVHYQRRLMAKGWGALAACRARKLLRRQQVLEFRERRTRTILRHVLLTLKSERDATARRLQTAFNAIAGRTKKKVFDAWKMFLDDRRRKKEMRERYSDAMERLLVKRVISIWWKGMIARRSFRDDLARARKNRDSRLAKRYFYKWMNHIEKMKCLHENCATFREVRANALMLHYVARLEEAWHERRDTAEKMEVAYGADRRMVKRRFLRKWAAYVVRKAEIVRECATRARLRKCIEDQRGWTMGEDRANRRQPIIPQYMRQEFVSIGPCEGFSGRWLLKEDCS